MTRSGTLVSALRPTGWMHLPHIHVQGVRAAVACVILTLAATVSASAAGFSEGLLPEERVASGVSRLTPAQVGALDALVGRDVALAHEGGVTGFSSSFTARHTAQERVAAGINTITDKERSMLDVLAARAIAYGPPPSASFAYAPPAAAAPPETLVSAPPKMQVHGDLAFTLGGGSHGSSFYGTSADLFVTDPSGKFTLGIGVSEFHSKGPIGLYGPYCPVPPIDPMFPYW